MKKQILPTAKLTVALAVLITTASCKTVRYVDRVKTVVDSTAVQQNEQLQQTLREEIERYEKQIAEITTTGVVFEPCDTVYGTRVVNRVVFDKGRLVSAEGRIKAVSQDLSETTSELYDAHSTIDSLQIELDRRDVQLSKKATEVVKQITKKVLPWWLILIAIVGGLALEYYLKPFTKSYNFISNVFSTRRPGNS